MDSKKLKITDSSMPDRISDLPSNIIECILDLLPIRDAVATSILSKEWRHKWTRIPNLVFDNEFVEHIIGYRSERDTTTPFEFSKIISKILVLHVGPIHKFFLRIPHFCNDSHLDLVSWMHFISRKEVKELTIEDRYAEIKLPSYIFNCSELQSLTVYVNGLDLHPPQGFGGFCNLRHLSLWGLLEGTQISNLVSKCPLLERLAITHVADGDTLVIDAPRLISLCAHCSLATILKLKNVHSLTTISLLFRPLGTMKFCQLFDIFGSLSKVGSVTLCNLRTINDIPRYAPTSLPTTLHNLRHLTLLRSNISSPQCIRFILCILKSSPNLQKLYLEIHPSAYTTDEAALQILDMPIKEPHTLNNLLTVKIKGILGNKVEIMFIKLILSSTPVLETMYLTGEFMVEEAEITFMSELLKCERRSPQAQATNMGSKQIKTTDFSLTDRISDLPNYIIECILDRLPIRDAVATSLLSKEWRHKWTRIPNLVFDNKFINNIVGYRSQREPTIPFIIGKILLLHVGPIHKFSLCIPSSVCNDLKLDLVSWMHSISRKEVKELTIQARAEIKLPSYIFNCSKLRSLIIVVPRLDLHPPQDFGGFCNLRVLGLLGVLDGTQISNLVSKCPLLETLVISVPDGDTLVIDAPRLLSLCCGFPLNTYLKLKNVRRVISISLSLRFGHKFCDLFDIFCSVPNVVNVTLSCLRAINDIPLHAPTSLPTTLHNLRHLTFLTTNISSPQCIQFILCILRSSPNLQKLNLEIHPSSIIRDEAALQFLDMQIKKPQTLNSLIIVKIKRLSGSNAEILFIKLILSCTPVLKTMYLTGNIVKEEEFTLMSELLKCKRLSPQAQRERTRAHKCYRKEITEMDSEQIVIDSSLPDRISDLPNNIINDCILNRIPIHDVVATSILSKGWRHKWRRIPNLVFDEKFKNRVIEARRPRGLDTARVKLVEYSNIIGKILLLHLGPIHKFVLHVPHVWNGLPQDFSSWMLFVSQNEIKELTIQAKNKWKVRLPSYVFQCNELRHLKLELQRLDLHPPQDFRGFCNLLSLDLYGILDGGESEISNLVSKCTLLERLSLNCIARTHPLVIDAPRLLFLHAYCSLNAFLKLKNCQKSRLLLCAPLQNIEAMPQDAPTSFPTTLHNHKSLTLLEIAFSSPQCIYFVLCILKCSPNLQKLNLGILQSETVEDEAALHLLEMETREPQTLTSLLTIKMKGILRSKIGIMFIKMILSSSPVLKTMYLAGFDASSSCMENDILNEAEVTLMSELLKFPRSSCRAQVNYSRYSGDSSIFKA
ncbi:unnamed protein product [Rhodiola kirilowii]